MADITKEEAIRVLLTEKKEEPTHIASNSGEYSFDDMVNDFYGSSKSFISDSAGLEYNAIKAIASLWGTGTFYTPQRILKMSRDVAQQIDNPSVPWLKAGLDKRYSFIFRESVRIEGDTKNLDDIRAIPGNGNFLKPVWNEQFNYTKDVCGNIFLVRNLKTGRLFSMPLSQIADIYTDVEDEGFINFIKITTNPQTVQLNQQGDTKTYIIRRHNCQVSDYQFRKATKESDPINSNYEFFDFHAAKGFGEPLARPPMLLATLYTSAAARYYADLSRYLHSSSLIAMKAVAATKESAKRGVETVADIRQAGAIAGFTNDYTLSGMNANSMNITSNTGISMLAAAAASINVPVSQFAMTVEGSSGTAGSLVTLDTSTKSYYASQRNIIVDFFKEILGDKIEISFVGNPADSVAKNVASATTAYNNHAIHQQEYRDYVVDQLNIEDPSDELPEIPEVPIPSGGDNTPTAISRTNGHDGEPGINGGEA